MEFLEVSEVLLRLQHVMKMRKLTRGDVAKLCGMSHQSISAVFRGIVAPNYKICRFVGVKRVMIVKYVNDDNRRKQRYGKV